VKKPAKHMGFYVSRGCPLYTLCELTPRARCAAVPQLGADGLVSRKRGRPSSRRFPVVPASHRDPDQRALFERRTNAGIRLVAMQFCHAESTFENMSITKRYLLEYGKPAAFHSGKHVVLRVNKTGATRRVAYPTQYNSGEAGSL